MGALKQLAIETEELFNADNFWAEFTKVEDHGLMMYAFCGSRWAWSNRLHKDNTHPTVTEPYYLGGEGVSGDSPIFCLECAIDFAMATGMQPAPNGTYASEEDSQSVYLAKHRVSYQPMSGVMSCPCGNALFAFYDVEVLAEAKENQEITQGQMADLLWLNGYYEATEGVGMKPFIEPHFNRGEGI